MHTFISAAKEKKIKVCTRNIEINISYAYFYLILYVSIDTRVGQQHLHNLNTFFRRRGK